jgi:hypothetical protein
VDWNRIVRSGSAVYRCIYLQVGGTSSKGPYLQYEEFTSSSTPTISKEIFRLVGSWPSYLCVSAGVVRVKDGKSVTGSIRECIALSVVNVDYVSIKCHLTTRTLHGVDSTRSPTCSWLFSVYCRPFASLLCQSSYMPASRLDTTFPSWLFVVDVEGCSCS